MNLELLAFLVVPAILAVTLTVQDGLPLTLRFGIPVLVVACQIGYVYTAYILDEDERAALYTAVELQFGIIDAPPLDLKVVRPRCARLVETATKLPAAAAFAAVVPKPTVDGRSWTLTWTIPPDAGLPARVYVCSGVGEAIRSLTADGAVIATVN